MDFLMSLPPKHFYLASCIAAIVALIIMFSTKKSHYKEEFKGLYQIIFCLSIVLGIISTFK